MPKISVIIPVYNAEQYLRRCLDSVCNQTLKDIEIICIDDFSSDGSAEILEKYSKQYPNLKFSRQEKNQGESAARNAGVALAKGEYMAFVDNDDELDLNFYEKLYDKAKENDADIVKGQAVEIDYNGRKHFIKQLPATGDKLLFTNYWWSAIFKRSLIEANNISFPLLPLGGDLLFLNRAVIAAKTLNLVDGVYYNYYRREDSGDSKILSEEKIKSVLSIHAAMIDNINSNIPASNSAYSFVFHHFIIGIFYLSLKSNEEKVKRLCAGAIMDFFEKCRDKSNVGIIFSKTTPHLFTMLNNKDRNAVEELLVKCKSRVELIAPGLRARLQNK